jgi:protein-disulfide isomerase
MGHLLNKDTLMLRAASLAVLAALATSPVSAQNLTPEDVKKLALEAILENPQIVMDAVEILREREAAETALGAEQALVQFRETLDNDPNAPVLGNPDGDVTLVEFFDYNCPYCRRAGVAVHALIDADPNLRVVYREWPILGPESVVATRASLASRNQGKYEEMHWALMGLEGRINENAVMRVASGLGMDLDRLKADMQLPEIDQHIATSMEISRGLGFNGTPSFVIGDATVPGFVEQEDLAKLVEQARNGS